MELQLLTKMQKRLIRSNIRVMSSFFVLKDNPSFVRLLGEERSLQEAAFALCEAALAQPERKDRQFATRAHRFINRRLRIASQGCRTPVGEGEFSVNSPKNADSVIGAYCKFVYRAKEV